MDTILKTLKEFKIIVDFAWRLMIHLVNKGIQMNDKDYDTWKLDYPSHWDNEINLEGTYNFDDFQFNIGDNCYSISGHLEFKDNELEDFVIDNVYIGNGEDDFEELKSYNVEEIKKHSLDKLTELAEKYLN